RHDAVDELPRFGAVELAEAERVEDGDRPRPHREDVAENPTDAGRRPLKRLDERRMVVALDLEDDRPAVADNGRARGLTGALVHVAAALLRSCTQTARRPARS